MCYKKLDFIDSEQCSELVQDATFLASCIYHRVSSMLNDGIYKTDLLFKISPNFSFLELVNTTCAPLSYNLPSVSRDLFHILFLTYYALEPIRGILGAFSPNSLYRSSKVNSLVGGSANSYHMKGLAVDIPVSKFDTDQIKELSKLCQTLRLHVIEHPTYWHIDLRYIKMPLIEFV